MQKIKHRKKITQNKISIGCKHSNRYSNYYWIMSRPKLFSQPVQARLSLADFQKFEALRKKKKITTGELARKLLSRSLSEVQIDA
jgi:hypothetical protein